MSDALLGSLHGQRSIYKGILLKRCHLSWKPRHVELVAQPKDISGHNYDFQLLIYEPRRHHLKNRIKMADIVTLRSTMELYFQIFLMSGKLLQLKTDTVERQAQWMAMLKMGLGKGSIFHVQVNYSDVLQHALLYSIEVNLSAQRAGQLDRVLVLASPINDINLHAWDLNRVRRFLQLDIGIRMELCTNCLQNKQERSITFIMGRMFIKDCLKFLSEEAQIQTPPVEESGFLMYNVAHQCLGALPRANSASPPPYSENTPPPLMPKGIRYNEEGDIDFDHDYDIAEFVETAATNFCSRDSLPLTPDEPPPIFPRSSTIEDPSPYDQPPPLFPRPQFEGNPPPPIFPRPPPDDQPPPIFPRSPPPPPNFDPSMTRSSPCLPPIETPWPHPHH